MPKWGVGPYRLEVDALRRRLIDAAVKANGGNLTAAGRTLGLSRTGVLKAMKRLGMRRGVR